MYQPKKNARGKKAKRGTDRNNVPRRTWSSPSAPQLTAPQAGGPSGDGLRGYQGAPHPLMACRPTVSAFDLMNQYGSVNAADYTPRGVHTLPRFGNPRDTDQYSSSSSRFQTVATSSRSNISFQTAASSFGYQSDATRSVSSINFQTAASSASSINFQMAASSSALYNYPPPGCYPPPGNPPYSYIPITGPPPAPFSNAPEFAAGPAYEKPPIWPAGPVKPPTWPPAPVSPKPPVQPKPKGIEQIYEIRQMGWFEPTRQPLVSNLQNFVYCCFVCCFGNLSF